MTSPLSRRTVLGLAVLGAGLTACGSSGPAASPPKSTESPKSSSTQRFSMPNEGDKHTRTWMAFGPTEEIWTAELLPEVRQNLADVALAIAKYQPVSMLVRSSEMSVAKNLVGSDVELVEAELDDLWVRDTGPITQVAIDGIAAGGGGIHCATQQQPA